MLRPACPPPHPALPQPLRGHAAPSVATCLWPAHPFRGRRGLPSTGASPEAEPPPLSPFRTPRHPRQVALLALLKARNALQTLVISCMSHPDYRTLGGG